MTTVLSERVWKRAYEDLKQRNEELLQDYKEKQCFENGVFQPAAYINTLIDKQLQQRRLKQWVITLSGKSFRLRGIGDKIIQFIDGSKEIVAAAAELEPHAALAWTGVSLLLPLILNSKHQNEVMLEGLEHVSHLIRLYKIREDLYVDNSTVAAAERKDFEDAVVDLYSHILEYQAQLLWHLSQRAGKRLLRNMAKLDSWTDWLDAVKTCDRKCADFTMTIDKVAERLAWQQWDSQFERSAHFQEQILEALRATRDARVAERNDDRREAFLQSLSMDYLAHKSAIPKRVPSTCEWFLQDDKFHAWRDSSNAHLLWVSAAPGCGKSVLAKTLVDERRVTNLVLASTVCYFFFRDGQQEQQTIVNALKAILHQLFSKSADPDIIEFALSRYKDHGNKLSSMSEELWIILTKTAEHQMAGEIVCVIDALDECEKNEREKLLRALSDYYSDSNRTASSNSRLKFLITSRPYSDISLEFRPLFNCATYIHFHGDEKTEIISEEINIVIDTKLEAVTQGMKPQDREAIAHHLKSAENRTYLWLHLALDFIKSKFTTQRTQKKMIPSILKELPSSVNRAYVKILEKIKDTSEYERSKAIFQIVIAARRPLTIRELQVASELAIGDYTTFDELESEILDDDAYVGVLNSLCGLLLTVYESRIYMIHQTAREFLVSKAEAATFKISQWEGSIKVQDAEHLMARTCMRMLILEEFSSSSIVNSMVDSDSDEATAIVTEVTSNNSSVGLDIDWADELDRYEEWNPTKNGTLLCCNFKNLSDRYSFLEYSAVHWTGHYRAIQNEVEAGMLGMVGLLCAISTDRCYIWTFFWNIYHELTPPSLIPSVLNSMELAAYCGLGSHIMQKFLDDGADVYSLIEIRPEVDWLPNFTASSTVLTPRQNWSLKKLETYYDDFIAADHFSMLYYIFEQDQSILDFLVDRGFDSNALVKVFDSRRSSRPRAKLEMQNGMTTMLGLACATGSHALVRKLVERGAIVEYRGLFKNTALSIAVETCKLETVCLLVEGGACINLRVIMSAINRKDHEICNYILKNAMGSLRFRMLGPWTDLNVSPNFYDLEPTEQVRILRQNSMKIIILAHPNKPFRFRSVPLQVALFKAYEHAPQRLWGPKIFLGEDDFKESHGLDDTVNLKEWFQEPTLLMGLARGDQPPEVASDRFKEESLKKSNTRESNRTSGSLAVTTSKDPFSDECTDLIKEAGRRRSFTRWNRKGRFALLNLGADYYSEGAVDFLNEESLKKVVIWKRKHTSASASSSETSSEDLSRPTMTGSESEEIYAPET